MAKFTTTDDKTDVSAATMHVRGTKRLHLVGAGEDRRVLKVAPIKDGVVKVTLIALFEDTRGIWTIDLTAVGKGSAEVRAMLAGKLIATVSITVEERITLPDPNTDAGLLMRLFLAECKNPDEKGYDRAEAKTAMQWMRVVIANRLKDPKTYYAKSATIKAIVTAYNQFAGFQDYPKIADDQDTRINELMAAANNDNHPKQMQFIDYLRDALEVASSKTVIDDPSGTGLNWWKDVGATPPEPAAEEFKVLAGNQFYRQRAGTK